VKGVRMRELELDDFVRPGEFARQLVCQRLGVSDGQMWMVTPSAGIATFGGTDTNPAGSQGQLLKRAALPAKDFVANGRKPQCTLACDD
jgi:hypothetical protein